MSKENIENTPLDYLALEFVKVTEVAAIAAAKWSGKGDKMSADKAAVDAMRSALNQIHFQGEIVIGEGAKDEAPELYVGEKVGSDHGPMVDIAVDPLECTSSVAHGRPNAIAVIAIGPKGSLYKAADSYMQKLAVGPEAKDVINLDAPVKETIDKVSRAIKKDKSEITVAILDRDRHRKLIEEVRQAGARVRLFTDGDVAMAVATCLPDSPIDILMGIGGSTEAVLAAAALKCLGGNILARWQPPADKTHIDRLKGAGIANFDVILNIDDLVKGDDITFTATGVLGGPLLRGVAVSPRHITTHSVVMSSNPKKVRFIETQHKTNLS
jgi:fructose-1,6-bisphosphatase II